MDSVRPFSRAAPIHHVNDRLTDPIDDPESNYVTPDAWQRRSSFARWIFEVQLTLAGRMLIGSWWRMGGFLASEARALARDEPGVRAAWNTHLILCVPVVYWVTVVCDIPLWLYIVAMVIPGNGILLIRSFAEHRARADVSERTTTVEGSWLLGPLFLFNNLHSLHHAEPRLPWYRYNARYGLRATACWPRTAAWSIRRISTSRDASCSGCTTSHSIRWGVRRRDALPELRAARPGMRTRQPLPRGPTPASARSPACRPPRSLRSAACPRIP